MVEYIYQQINKQAAGFQTTCMQSRKGDSENDNINGRREHK